MIAQLVDEVLKDIAFTAPIELADVVTVHARIAAKLPAGVRLECYHRIRDVVIETRETIKGRAEVTCRRVVAVDNASPA